jgi:FKBP-type peptidyl-prolyl cis-trans isomerase
MRIKILFLLLAVTTVVATTSCQKAGLGKKMSLKTEVDSASYAIGVIIAQQNKMGLQQYPGGEQIDKEILAKSFQLFLGGDSAQMTPSEANEILGKYFEKMRVKVAQENLEAGNAFLEKNKAKSGVVTTPSGLQYEIIKEGTGPKPDSASTVKVHYHGTTIDGKVFDSSVDRGEPVEFPVTRVIPGWTEALLMMPVGSKWKICLPANIAYGEQGAGANIAPNSALVFEVELLEIKPQEPAAPTK